MNKTEPRLRRAEAALLAAMACSLTACGGGGGYVRPTPTAPVPAPAPAPPPPPAPAPAPAPTPPQPPIDAQIALTNTQPAHDAGFIGTGVTIGIIDSGIMRNHPALAGRVKDELIYVDPTTNNTKIDDVVGHGTWVSEIAAGKPFGNFVGGIAPGADLVSARIISDVEPKDDGSGMGNEVTSANPLGQINDALINDGVKVINNSFGGLYWSASATNTTKSFHDAYDRFINSWGGLVVFAAGNDSAADPGDLAALPARAPDLEKGWLTVVAVDSLHPTQLASYSNACGVSLNYCLAAPGGVIVSGKDDTPTNETYYIVEGTSLAAPQVSGAAAVVWQAFPYFTNDLVRQTLLGTADDLGAPGPDAVFGYGELDVGAAVLGPAKFDWGDVTVNFAGPSTWSNAISGKGGLIKQGTGTLTLTEASTYSGDTQVQGGTLIAQSLAGNASILAQAALSGSDVAGNVTNAGTFTVRGDANNTIGGNYTQQVGARLSLALGSELLVTGTATLNGGDLYVTGTNSGYVVDSHTEVLKAGAGLAGTFNTLDTPSNVLLTATLNYDANTAWLDVQQVSVTAVQGAVYTTASYGAAQRVQSAFNAINTSFGPTAPPGGVTPIATSFVSGAGALQQSSSVASFQKTLESLSGQLHAASAAMTFQAIDAGTRALSDRFETLLDRPQTGGWTQSLGYQGGLSRSGYSNVGYDLNGFLVGSDYRIGSNGIAGYAISRTQGLGRMAESADQGRSHALEGMLYGGVLRGQWYSMGRFGFGNYREDTRRQLQLGQQFAGVESLARGRYGVAYGESGYRLNWGATELTPYMNLQYAQINRDGFNEYGAGGFGLKSDANTASRWQAGAGLRASRGWNLATGGRLELQGHMVWQQSFGVSGDVFQASFSGINQYAPLGGIGLSRYGGVVGTTLDWSMTPSTALSLSYDDYLGQRQHAQMGSVNFNWRF